MSIAEFAFLIGCFLGVTIGFVLGICVRARHDIPLLDEHPSPWRKP